MYVPMSLSFVDYHVHSNHSSDSDASLAEMCGRAIQLGIVEIGFSEHVDFDPRDWGYKYFDYERYSSDIRKARELFGDRLVVRKGIEVDYQHWFEEDIREWLRDKEFDYVIGSVHYLDHKYITEKLISEKTLQEIYDLYFAEVNNSIDSGLFDVIGHLDLPRRYTYRSKDELKRIDYWETMRTTFNKIIDTETYLEINSKGLREPCRDTYPSKEVVNEYYETGGRMISLGSDAHCIEEIGVGIEEIMNCLSGKRITLFQSL